MSVMVKVLNAREAVATHRAVKGQLLMLKATEPVNYQLIDEATGWAPAQIVLRREGRDLLLDVDGDGQVDVLIQQYFTMPEGAVVGQNADGQWHAYVPQSAQAVDAVNGLVEGARAEQVLAHESLATPLWQGRSSLTWLKMAAPFAFAGVAALAVAHDGNEHIQETYQAASPQDVQNHQEDVVTNSDHSVFKSVAVHDVDDAPMVRILGGDDGVLGMQDLVDGRVQVHIRLPEAGRYQVGDVLTVRDASGNEQSLVLNQEHLHDGVTVGVLPVDGRNEITATVYERGAEHEPFLGVMPAQGGDELGVALNPPVQDVDMMDLSSDKAHSETVLSLHQTGIAYSKVLMNEGDADDVLPLWLGVVSAFEYSGAMDYRYQAVANGVDHAMWTDGDISVK